MLGIDPFGAALDHTLTGEFVQGHAVQVLHLPAGSDVVSCKVLFVGRDERDRLARLTGLAGRMHTLTIGEWPRFIADGGAIRLDVDHGRVRFDLNLEATRASGLAVDARLIRVARTVFGGGSRP